MSCNRENVVWQSANGTWNIGFYSYEYINRDSEDFDHEWDVNYDFDTFHWASTGHPTKQSAINSWTGANPGSHDVAEYKGNASACKNYDEMVKCLRDPAYAAARKDKMDRESVRKTAARVKESLTETPRAGMEYSVLIGLDGCGWSMTSRLVQEGDWLVMKNGRTTYRVYNTKTDKVWVGKSHGRVAGVQSLRKVQSRVHWR